MTSRFGLHAALTTCTVLLAGCGSGGYYMVRDPGSAAPPYYTSNIGTSGSAVQFKDARTGSSVTLQSSEVKKISKEEFTQALTVPAVTVGAQSPAAPSAAPLPSGSGASAPEATPLTRPQ